MSSRDQTKIILLIVGVLLVISSSRVNGLEIPRLVETGSSKLYPGGTHVAVNVPLIFSMDMDTRPKHSGVKMDLNVLKGLVHVAMDRQADASGNNSGPIKVSIEGMTVYDNEQ